MRLPAAKSLLFFYRVGVVSAGPFNKLLARAVSPDNTCGTDGVGGGADGYTCPSDLPCCSVNGYCGSTTDYCSIDNGCQSAFGNCTAPSSGTVSPDMTCGITGGGTDGYTCASSTPCCSGRYAFPETQPFISRNTHNGNSGYCGTTSDYCSVDLGCQSTFGTCDSATNSSSGGGTVTGGTSTNGQCGPGQGTCASNECCSLAGWCGVTEGKLCDCSTNPCIKCI